MSGGAAWPRAYNDVYKADRLSKDAHQPLPAVVPPCRGTGEWYAGGMF